MPLTRSLRCFVVGVVLLGLPPALRAQAVIGQQNLSFGTVIPGVPTTIARTDPVGSGQFRITSGWLQNVTVSFTLPTVMNGPLGATMPITFLNTDGGFSGWNGSITNQTQFNPNSPYNGFIWWGTAVVYLGGRVNPSPTQRGGSYTANIVMTVIFL